jgi:hypothetical protein
MKSTSKSSTGPYSPVAGKVGSITLDLAALVAPGRVVGLDLDAQGSWRSHARLPLRVA